MENPNHPTEESFLKNVANHEMQVILDDGIHRHIRFKNPKDSTQWFELVTWPDYLAYVGDMGSYTFSRLKDMFEFFRTAPKGETGLHINPSYWGEKLEAVERHNGYHQFAPDKVREQIEEKVVEWVEEYGFGKEEVESLREELSDHICYDDGLSEAYSSVGSFHIEIAGHDLRFEDIFEWVWEDFTGRYIWCCYALAWGIKKYDEAKVNSSLLEEK
jgi:hypothetical protein